MLWSLLVEAVARPDFGVVDPPLLDDLAGVADAVEPVLVQAFVAEFAVEALHVAVLLRLARLDEGVLHPVAIAPPVQGHSRELGPVVRVDPLGLAVKLDEIVQDPRYAMPGYRAVDLDLQTALGMVVHHCQHPHPPALPSGVVHEVHAPSLIGLGRLEDLVDARQAMALPLPAPDLETRVAIYPIRALEVHFVAFPADEDMQPPVSPSLALEGLSLDQLQQSGIVAGGTVRVAAPGHADKPAGKPKAHAAALAKMVDRSTLLYGLDQFFELIFFRGSMLSSFSARSLFRQSVLALQLLELP